MWFKELKKYIGLFILAVAIIVVYKTFDNFSIIIDWTKQIIHLLTPFVIGFCIAYVLFVPCQKLERLLQKTKVKFFVKSRRGVAVATIYLLFLAAIALLLVAIIPAVVRSISEFIEQFPSIVDSIIQWINSLHIVQIEDLSIQKLFNNNLFSLQKLIESIDFNNMNKYAKGVMNFGTGLFNIFMGLVISIYILLDRKSLKDNFTKLTTLFISDKRRAFFGRYLKTINEFIQKYISCQLVDAGIVFLISFIILSIVRVKYAPLLALLIGAFNLIPYFGAVTATAFAAILTVFTGSFTQGVIVAVSQIALQQLDANFIQPKLLAGSLQVKPFWVIFGILLGGGLFGVFGIFLAVPIVALLRSILLDIFDLKERKMKERATIENTLSENKNTDIKKDEPE